MPTLRYWAAARDAAGCAEERLAGGTLAELLAAAAAGRDARFASVLARSSYLVDGVPVGTRDPAAVAVAAAATVEVLPPFAGG